MGFVISMKFFSKFRTLAILAVALMAIGTRAEAQGYVKHRLRIAGATADIFTGGANRQPVPDQRLLRNCG